MFKNKAAYPLSPAAIDIVESQWLRDFSCFITNINYRVYVLTRAFDVLLSPPCTCKHMHPEKDSFVAHVCEQMLTFSSMSTD